jgi:hypothetical protein
MANREDVQKRAFDAFSQTEQGKAAIQWEETQRKQKAVAERLRQEQEAAKAKEAGKLKQPGNDMAASISGNIIGVGSNPVLSAIHEQTELAKQQVEYLQIIASKGTGTPSADVTDKGATPVTPANTSPSRAALLTKK